MRNWIIGATSELLTGLLVVLGGTMFYKPELILGFFG
jgi:hypothetical protein